MVLGIIAKTATYESILTLNFRKKYDIRHIVPSATSTLQKEIEASTVYTHILLDIDAVRGNADNGVALVDRLLKTTQITLLVLADGYPEDSRLVQDLSALGIVNENIILADGTRLKMRLSRLLQGLDKIHMPAEPCIAAMEISPPDALTVEPVDTVETTTLECLCQLVTPPSQINVVAAKQMMIKKPEHVPAPKAVTIAVAGAGKRIGTTTQCMQLFLFLCTQDYTVALVEMHGKNKLQQYIEVYEKTSEILDDTHFILQGNHFFSSPKALIKAKSEFDYLICDYGEYNSIVDTVSYFEKDIRLIVAGVKPWESDALGTVFPEDDGTLNYVFSFVPKADESEVLWQMLDSAEHTYFAAYTPDYFGYGGEDAMYQAIIKCGKKQQQAVRPPRFKLPHFGGKKRF